MEHLPAILIHLALGFSLAACAGLRAFLPLLVIGLMSRFGYFQAGQGFAWIGSDCALIVFAAATVFEILGDKFPALDHFLDTCGLVIKPVAGSILFASVIINMDPMYAVIFGIIAGGGISGLIHVKKSALRLLSTGMTLGFANPVISVIEDFCSGFGVLLSIVAPVLALIIIATVIMLIFKFYTKLLKSKDNKKTAESEA